MTDQPRTRRVLLGGIVTMAVLAAAFIVVGVVRSTSGQPAEATGPWRDDAVLTKARDDFGTAVVDDRI